ncbi:ribonuclease HII [Malacoplasma muris]|uniref:ribonuclease HII n=1 Tax=Malacoplasma muris TaxID=2119 RepID=UPI00398EFD70
MIKNKLFEYDNKIRNSYKNILGIDEVGRGCVAGPLVVAGVILKKDFYDSRIQDSKKIKTLEKRKELANLIIKNCIKYKYVIFNNKEVDLINPKQCSKSGMKEIAIDLQNYFDIAITDYENIDLDINQINLKQGDNKCFSVACASILAKHIRDLEIIKLNNLYPEYDFINNQGYLTKNHISLLKEYGVKKEIYRLSYKPIKKILNNLY